MRKVIPCLILSLLAGSLLAQTPKDATVPIVAAISVNPPGIALQWANPVASDLLILRRTKGQAGNQWVQLLNLANSPANAGIDANVVAGQTYEYYIRRTSNVTAYGYAHIAVEAPVTDHRGTVLLFTDGSLVAPLAVEIERLKNDLRGDGWKVVEHIIPATATVQSVKSQIIEDYNADPAGVKSVFLLGSIPVPYSGNTQWDGHPEHQGAWPADSYYAELDGVWTDATVNTMLNGQAPGRAATANLPGDGKFDQSYIPSPAELAVGRVDFRHIDAVAFGVANKTELYRRYLNKDHDWRAGIYQTEKRALVDDNFGYFGGEAFAANGFRNAYPLVGESNVVAADFFNNTNPERWLLGYGTGGGSYTSAGGVGNSSNFATDTVHIVFSNLFGSYHGDWDYEVNPFMPSALASRGGILTCAWAGRPHHFYQALASGETIGFCTKETLNARFNDGYFASAGEGGAHISLLGDPTLRAHIVPPARNVSASLQCSAVGLKWDASADTSVAGYLVYRATTPDGPYTRLTINPVAATTYTDGAPLIGTLYYSVRAAKREGAPGGGIYWNTSTGAPVSVSFAGGKIPQVIAAGDSITCSNPIAQLASESDAPGASYLWTGPDNFSSQQQNTTATVPGVYTLLVKAPNGCTAAATTLVELDTLLPSLNLDSKYTYNCLKPCVVVNLASVKDVLYSIDNQPVDNYTLTLCHIGQYILNIQNTRNGCSKGYPFEVEADVAEPGAIAGFSGGGIINCQPQPVELAGNSSAPIALYSWSGPGITPANQFLKNPVVTLPGTYILTVTNPLNGCTSTDQVAFEYDSATLPSVGISPAGSNINCMVASIPVCGEITPASALFYWSGPNGFTSTQKCITVTEPGVYALTAANPGTGCSATATATFNLDIAPPDLSLTTAVLTCAMPTAQICAQSNTPGTRFSWQGTEQKCINVTKSGDYTCVATAPNGCTSTATTSVAEDYLPPSLSITGLPELNCALPCLLIESPSANISFPPQTICQPGNYTVVATAVQNGCTSSVSFDVTQAPPLVVNLLPAVLGCDESFTVEAQASGGTPPYHYLWTTGDTSASVTVFPNVTSLAVTVTDGGGCSFQSPPFTVVYTPGMVISAVPSNESAMGAKDGKATAGVMGGIAPYTYLWSNGQTTMTATGLAGGTYTVTVTDTRGCTSAITVTVNTTSGTDESTWISTFLLSPNPTDGLVQLTLNLLEPEQSRVSVHDAVGRLIFEEKGHKTSMMSQKIDIRLQPSGVYWVRAQAGEKSAVRKLVVLRG